jgi:hypothetical protein
MPLSEQGGAASSGRLSTRQRVASSMPFPASSTTGAIPRNGFGKLPVFGWQYPILFGAARGDYAIGNPACGNDSVVTGRTQPSAEAFQHLVAQEPRHPPVVYRDTSY